MRVLAVQRRGAGEVLMTTPALRALKARFPRAVVTFFCERPYAPLLRGNGLVDAVVGVEPGGGVRGARRLLAGLRAGGFDLALDFESSPATAALVAASRAARRIGFRGGIHALAYTDRAAPEWGAGGYVAAEKLALVAPLGIDVRGASLRPALAVPPAARDWGRRTLEQAAVGSADFLVTLAPDARSAELAWPLERYAALLDLLAATYVFEAILLPGPGAELGQRLAQLTAVPLFQLSVPPSPAQVAALLDRADLHIGNENMARHMATALGTATVALHAPGRRRRWSLPGDPLQVGLEPPGPWAETAGAPAGAVTAQPIARITAEEACSAVLRLEPYLPRLRAARRERDAQRELPLPRARLTSRAEAAPP